MVLGGASGIRARSAPLRSDPVSRPPTGARRRIRSAESAGGAPVHEDRGTRPGVSHGAFPGPGMGAGASGGARAVRRRLRRVGLGLLLATGVAAVSAHTGGSTGYAALLVNRGTVRYSLTLPTAT